MGRYVVRVAEEYYDLDDCDWRGYPKRKIRYTGEEYETSEEPDDSIGCSVMSDGYTESHTVLRGSSTTSEKKKEPVDERKSMKTAILPDKITKISKRELDPYCILENLIIGKNVVEIEEGAFSWSYRLESIEVKEDNPFFTSKDGVLYDKQMTTLIRFPHD